MTRRDYELVAATLRNSRPGGDQSRVAQWTRDVQSLAVAFKGANERFDIVRFLAAAGCE